MNHNQYYNQPLRLYACCKPHWRCSYGKQSRQVVDHIDCPRPLVKISIKSATPDLRAYAIILANVDALLAAMINDFDFFDLLEIWINHQHKI